MLRVSVLCSLFLLLVTANSSITYSRNISTGIRSSRQRGCLGPPYLYITFHGGKSGTNNIYRYSRDGQCVLQNVLVGGDPYELRKPTIDGDGGLLQNFANKDESKIVKYSGCTATGHRNYLGVVVDGENNAELVHPYGLSFDNRSGYVFATTQDTYKVLRFDGKSGRPAGINANVDGVFADLSTDDLRGVDHGYVDGVFNLFVADKDKGVLLYSQQAQLLATINITSAIGLHFVDRPSGSFLYIGSSDSNEVYEFSFSSRSVTRTFSSKHLQHPAGIVVYEETLFVLNQGSGTCQTYDLTTGQHNGEIITSLPDTVENVILSDC